MSNQAFDFHLLFAEYGKEVYRFIYHLVQDPAEAEDLSQEAFIKIYLCASVRKYWNNKGKIMSCKYKMLSCLFLYSLSLLSFSVFWGCSPITFDAKKVFENRWEKKVADSVIKIRRFKEVFTQYDNIFSEKVYIVGYEAEIEYLEDVNIDHEGERLKTYKKGEVVKEEGVIMFRKTDKGWIHYGTKIINF